MTAARALVRREGLMGDAIPGDGLLMHPTVGVNAVDAASTISTTLISGGIYERSGLTVGRQDTLFTAAEFIAAFPHLQVGESMMFIISNISGFTLTVASPGAPVTLAGATTVTTLAMRFMRVQKTSSTTVTVTLM